MTTLIGIILIAVGSFNIFQYNKAVEGNFYITGTLVRYSYSPSFNKHYPVFKYTVDGIIYEEEYRGTYNNRAREELKNINIFSAFVSSIFCNPIFFWIIFIN